MCRVTQVNDEQLSVQRRLSYFIQGISQKSKSLLVVQPRCHLLTTVLRASFTLLSQKA